LANPTGIARLPGVNLWVGGELATLGQDLFHRASERARHLWSTAEADHEIGPATTDPKPRRELGTERGDLNRLVDERRA
jgi:hypothetical protein